MRSDPFYMTYISANGIGDDVEKNDDDENGDGFLYDKHISQWSW